MSGRIRAHLRSNVVGYLAVFLALTGTAVALPGKNRIDRNDLQKRVVKPINVQRNAIRRFQLAPSAVHRWHLAPDATVENVSAHKSVLNFGTVSGVDQVAQVTLQTKATSRILASATMVVGDNVADTAICWLNAGGAPNDGANDISQRAYTDAGDGAVKFESLAVNGSVVKGPGTHVISLYCSDTTGTPTVDRIDLLAWATSP
jgi:hypothetical protein